MTLSAMFSHSWEIYGSKCSEIFDEYIYFHSFLWCGCLELHTVGSRLLLAIYDNVSFLFDFQSLSGSTSPIESVSFDPMEVLVLAGSFNGTIKLWDLEEAKSESYIWICVSIDYSLKSCFFLNGGCTTRLSFILSTRIKSPPWPDNQY